MRMIIRLIMANYLIALMTVSFVNYAFPNSGLADFFANLSFILCFVVEIAIAWAGAMIIYGLIGGAKR